MAFDIISMILIVVGLCLFETVSGIDNAVINAEVLRTMSQKARRWFLLWGILIAVADHLVHQSFPGIHGFAHRYLQF